MIRATEKFAEPTNMSPQVLVAVRDMCLSRMRHAVAATQDQHSAPAKGRTAELEARAGWAGEDCSRTEPSRPFLLARDRADTGRAQALRLADGVAYVSGLEDAHGLELDSVLMDSRVSCRDVRACGRTTSFARRGRHRRARIRDRLLLPTGQLRASGATTQRDSMTLHNAVQR